MEQKDILNSWKEISYYLDRNVRTCQRWKIELALPVHRIDKNSQHSKVFAYKSEIDQWLKEKAESKEIKKKSLLEYRWSVISLISILGLLSVIFLFLFFTERISFFPQPEYLSLAVLPFENLNKSKQDEYFSEGMTNEITNKMTMLNELKVIPAVTVSKYNNSSQDARQIVEELSIDYILEGKTKKDGDKITIGVKLIRTKDYNTIWSEEFEGSLENVFFIQESICRKIHEKLNLNIDQNLSVLANVGKTNDYLAYDNYLKGNYILSRLNEDNDDPWKLYHQGKFHLGKCTSEGNKLAINLFSQAVEIDRNFALAYIGLALCYSNYVNFNWDFDLKWVDKAEDLIKEAHAISPDLPEYYSTLIEIYLIKEVAFNENTRKLAFKLAREGIKKYPDNAQLNSIVGYCYYLRFGEEGSEDDFKKALEYKEKSFWLNPYGINNLVYAELLMLNKEFYRALEICNIVEKQDYSLMSKFRLGEIYYYLGDLETSKAIFQQFDIAPLDLKISSLFFIGMIHSQRGEGEKALKIIDDISLISPKEFVLYDHLKLASIYMGLGMKESGYKNLKTFFNMSMNKKMRYAYLKYIDFDRNFDNIREEEEFIKIIKNKGEING
jgi:TolB-like protein